jgi:hypothetical protein
LAIFFGEFSVHCSPVWLFDARHVTPTKPVFYNTFTLETVAVVDTKRPSGSIPPCQLRRPLVCWLKQRKSFPQIYSLFLGFSSGPTAGSTNS